MKTHNTFAATLTAGAVALALAGCGGNPANNAPPANNAAAPANAAAAPGANPFAAMGGPPAAAPAPSTVHYVNAQAYPQEIASEMVDFSFDYPSDMSTVPGKRFIWVATYDAAHLPNSLFAASPVPNEPDQSRLSSDLAQISTQFGSSFGGYQQVDESATTFGGWPAMQVRFSASPTRRDGSRVIMYGKVIYIPGFGGTNSLMVMMVSQSSDQARTIEDLGTKGDLATIQSSFRMGK